MITVTEEAKRYVRTVSTGAMLPEGLVFRLDRVKTAQCSEPSLAVIVDEPREGDQLVEHEGEDLLHISGTVSAAYDGFVLDLEGTPRGHSVHPRRPARGWIQHSRPGAAHAPVSGVSLMAEPFRRRAREQLLPPSGYTLDKSDPDILVLRRADGSFVAAFSSRAVTSEGIREAVEADVREQEPFSRRQNDPGTCPADAGSGGTRIDGTLRWEGHLVGPPYYLVARSRPRGAQVLTFEGIGGGPALPVFSSQEGAWEFLRSYVSKGGWEATPIGIGGLLSLLCGSCAEVGCVALDPSTEIVAEGATGLVSLPRQIFVDSLLGRGRTWVEDRNREGGRTHG